MVDLNTNKLIGVVSFGMDPCAEDGFPGVYSRVAVVRSWIKSYSRVWKFISRGCWKTMYLLHEKVFLCKLRKCENINFLWKQKVFKGKKIIISMQNFHQTLNYSCKLLITSENFTSEVFQFKICIGFL